MSASSVAGPPYLARLDKGRAGFVANDLILAVVAECDDVNVAGVIDIA